ncbi:hypothetical protein HF313_10165 [Massilia atriviolacea]|uniref:Uncharacterized protein n=1 Tax=Massilia atriviolacea TaxID=2495579 RepID=A0A430HI36_9BURK|nr:hypothetical protein [Massilia atriviolacea]RSZ57178.1 hypothetical protein EJB06_20885 [Massilia atriviolacea]
MVATQAGKSAYGARDIVNAPALKQAIARRSVQRGDAPDVAEWLANHFFRYAVGNLEAPEPALLRVASGAQARTLFAPAAVPAWVTARLGKDGGEAMWWLAPDGPELLAIEAKLVELLCARQGTALEGKLQRINCRQALALWSAEHAAFEAKSAAGWREHQPAAVATRWQGEAGAVLELLPASPLLRGEMAFESQVMRHCLGQFSDRRALRGGYGEHYAAACEAGQMRLFSYRGRNGHAHITISAHVAEGGRLRFDQIKGKLNRPPVERFHGELLAFLRSVESDMHTPPDALSMGMVRLPSGWAMVEEAHHDADQLFVAQHFPALFRRLRAPSVLAQWIAAARAPEQLQGMPLHPAVAHALKGAP